MNEVKKSLASRKNKLLTVPENLPEIYADGFSAAMFGYPVSKVMFHSASMSLNGDAKNEDRVAVAQLTLPTHALIQFAKHILESIGENELGLNERMTTYNSAVSALISSAGIQKDSE